MSRARSFSKLINKSNYLAHRGTSSVADLSPTETDVAAEISSNPIPAFVGMIGAFSMATTTEWKTTNRWIVCDGSAISRTIYSDLFTVVGTTWGVGDGSSTFNLPNLQGAFLRGTGTGIINARNKTAVAVGSFQEDNFQSHHHQYRSEGWQTGYSGGMNLVTTSTNYNQTMTTNHDIVQYGSNGTPRHTSETYPYNASVQFCIKF
jgi:microcystin-dependent protein